MFVDTHTHLYADVFNADRAALITKAINSGIKKFYMPNIDPDSVAPMMAVAAEFPENCFPMMGLHPGSVDAGYREKMDQVQSAFTASRFYAVGEIGIDLYWDKTHLVEQKEVFASQVQLALDHRLPIVIHTRESFDVTCDILRSFKVLPKGIFHCFTGDTTQARKVLALGEFKLGIGGVLTFRNSGLDKVAESIDLRHMVLETDAPYLAPAPFRGKRNEPQYLLEIARKLAAVKNVSIHEVEELTTASAAEVFGH